MSGPECCENPPTLSPRCGAGHIKEIGGLDCYVSGPPGCSLAIVLVSDVYGYEAPNLRKLADKLAAAGFCVLVPDFLHGDPYQPGNPERPIQEWLKDHSPDNAADEAKTIFENLKRRAVSKVAAVGFCWGAKVVVELAEPDYLQAAVLCHPSFVTVDDIRNVKVPIAILGAEQDSISPPELLRQFEEILHGNPEVDGFVKIFPNVSHGWTVRYNPEDPEAVKAAEEAHQDILNWIVKHLKPETLRVISRPIRF